uniref:Uncharacterized protein n=1 Tax=Opuntia streptacantha TaxID=393608 RepID=A0A7C8Z693_OPUST
MEDTTWEQRSQALTHILTSPTTNPSLDSQFFISTQVPCYLNWDYPPLLCSKPHPETYLRKWAFSLFLKRVSRLGQPLTSWRSKCPYHQPPPLILAKGVEEARWDDQGKKQYVRKRLARKRLQSEIIEVLHSLLMLHHHVQVENLLKRVCWLLVLEVR